MSRSCRTWRRARTMSWCVGFGHEGARDPETVAAEIAVINAEP